MIVRHKQDKESKLLTDIQAKEYPPGTLFKAFHMDFHPVFKHYCLLIDVSSNFWKTDKMIISLTDCFEIVNSNYRFEPIDQGSTIELEQEEL